MDESSLTTLCHFISSYRKGAPQLGLLLGSPDGLLLTWFYRSTAAMTSSGIDFKDLLQPFFTTYDMAMPSESTAVEYLIHIVELHPL